MLVVVGSESVADAIRQVASAAGPVQGRRIAVKQVDGDDLRRQRDVLRASHLVFVDRSGGVSARDAIELLQGTHVLTVGDMWRALPMDKRITMKWWQVPRAEIPADRAARIEWLFDWWERIDAWVEQHKPEDLSPRRRRRT